VLALEPGEGQPVRDCWTVAFGNSFNDEERCIAAGYDNGDVKLFDLRTRCPSLLSLPLSLPLSFPSFFSLTGTLLSCKYDAVRD
jgi:hypothetical protein